MRRLRTSKNKTANDQSREHRRGHHTAPIHADDRARADIVEDEVRRIADHSPEGRPHLPLHDQGTTDGWWCRFGRVYRHGR